MKTEILIVGGGTGGVAAALAACRMGRRVVMTEPTDWIGGQLTSQAVPPDENDWIEHTGATESYRQYRALVRQYYRDHYRLSEVARYTKPAVQYLNPGNGVVGRLCHEFRVSVKILEGMLSPFVHSGQLILLLDHKPVAADVNQDHVRSVVVKCLKSGKLTSIDCQYVLDATELGDLLPMTGTEYVNGSEARSETGEAHAGETAKPLNMQGVTACFAVDYLPNENHIISKPAMYDFWRSYQPDKWCGPLLDWTYPRGDTGEPVKAYLFGENNTRSMWLYRRIIDSKNFEPGVFPSDITLVNYPQNDYVIGPVCEVEDSQAALHEHQAKQLSLSLLYWMQTEAPRADGGVGYPGLRLRHDVVGTTDGLAKHLYIRESRRIRAEFTIKEHHVAAEAMPGRKVAAEFADPVGIGHYRLDLHCSTGGDFCIDIATLPFQIPLGALLPRRMENLLPACKNIGTTHLTNGCYRLHPIEWNIGEAAGALAAYCIDHNNTPRQVRNNVSIFAAFQETLVKLGFVLEWRF
jgi:hypothetical protein